jgi:hypothetical protein
VRERERSSDHVTIGGRRKHVGYLAISFPLERANSWSRAFGGGKPSADGEAVHAACDLSY